LNSKEITPPGARLTIEEKALIGRKTRGPMSRQYTPKDGTECDKQTSDNSGTEESTGTTGVAQGTSHRTSQPVTRN